MDEVCACDCRMNVNGKCTAPCEHRRTTHTPAAPAMEPTTEACRTCSFADVCSQEASASCERAIIEQIKQAARKAEREQVLDGLDEIKKKCDANTSISPHEFHKGQAAAYHLVKWWIDELIESLRGGA